MRSNRTFCSKVVNGPQGNRAGIIGPWSEEVREFVVEKEITDLVFNSALGWQGTDFTFLKTLPFLRSLEIIGVVEQGDDCIAGLVSLERLILMYTIGFRFSAALLQSLSFVSVEHWKNASSLFECTELRTAKFFDFQLKNWSPISRLCKLEKLEVTGGNLHSLEPVGDLIQIRDLELARLKQLDGIAHLSRLCNLEVLRLSECPTIKDFESLAGRSRLRVLNLVDQGTIEDLDFLHSLPNLQELFILGNTRIRSNDLSPLASLSNLRRWAFSHGEKYHGFAVKGGP